VPVAAIVDGMNTVQLTPDGHSHGSSVEILRIDLFVKHGSEHSHGEF
jgi:hypothetical protein